MSNHSSELTLTEAAELKAKGYTTVIVGTGPGVYGEATVQQATAALAVGMNVEAYVYLEGDADPRWWVEQAVKTLRGTPVARWWLNLEEAPVGTLDDIIAFVNAALDELDTLTGQLTGICTAGWFWKSVMQNTDVFAKQGRKLWNAWYDEDPDIDGLPFGGWTKDDVAIEQYQGTTTVAGQSVDLDAIYIRAGEPQKGEGMTDKERQLLITLANILVGPGDGSVWSTVDEALAGVTAYEGQRIHAGLAYTQSQLDTLGRVAVKLGDNVRLAGS